ncbi:hypothetical protein QAD02_006719 [Eretmocerus hayati]|uniref:Uncharacterized protein n=1 Tax=Eretmocerus hayati TaxID=131215 RepID=A0ACC2N1Q2_9HYME|nr:hypothetical protein QAD02_006719 [Eretmocerus hayati]
MEGQLIGQTRLLIDGYVYSKHQNQANTTSWVCVKYCNRPKAHCSARASSSNISKPNGKLSIFKGPKESCHNHPPDPEDIKLASKLAQKKATLKGHNEVKKSSITDENSGSRKTNKARISKTTKIVKETSPIIMESNIPIHEHFPGSTKVNVGKKSAQKQEDTTVAYQDFIEDPVRYREFLLKFTENPSFGREAIMKALNAVSDLGISRTAACALIQSNESKITADLDKLSTSIIGSPLLSPPIIPSTISEIISVDTLSKPPETVSDVENVEPVCGNRIKTKKRKLENEKIMGLLRSTMETTLKTMQNFTEFMTTKKEKRKKKKEKKEKRKIIVRIVPPVPENVPTSNAPSHASQSDLSSNLTEKLAKRIKQEIPVIDLADDDNMESSHGNEGQCSIRIESTSSVESSFFDSLSTPDTTEQQTMNYNRPNHANSLAAHGLMQGYHYDSSTPFMNNRWNTQEPMYNPVILQQFNPGYQILDWSAKNLQVARQNSTGISNSYQTGASHPFAFGVIQNNPNHHAPR